MDDQGLSQSIKAITVSKRHDPAGCRDSIWVEVEFKQRVCIRVALDEGYWYPRSMDDTQRRRYEEHRHRRAIAARLAHHLTGEIAEAMGRLDSATLMGESVTLRKS